MTTDAHPYTLTPADITDLRFRMARRGMISDGERASALPYVQAARSGWEFYLHAGGFTVAVSRDANVILACLRNEALQPGWCRMALDPQRDPEEALLDPATQQARETQRRATAATQRLQDEAEAERLRRRRSQLRQPDIDPTTLTLDWLLDPAT